MSDLAAWEVHAAWHEAVAVVRQVAALAGADAHHPRPDASNVFLSIDGSVRVEAAGEAGSLVPALSNLLAALLTETAPGDLRLLADSANEGVRRSTRQEFASALSFFARPDDSAEVRALVTLALAARDAVERSHALQSLTERARRAPAPVGSRAGEAPKPQSGRGLAVVAAGGSVLLIAGVGGWALIAGTGADAPAPAAISTGARSVARRVQHGVATAAALVRETIEGAPEPAATRDRDLQLPRVRRRTAPRTETQRPQVTVGLPVETPVEPGTSSGGGGDLPLVTVPSEDGVQHEPVAAPHGVFSAAHPDVSPPALVRAQMPETFIGGLPPERPGVLELVVAEDGQVLSARLVPNSNRHQDRMMVSAAKAWRFSPAMRDGQPVRYRLQMPITW